MSKSEQCGWTAHNGFMRVGGLRRAASAFALALAVCAAVTTSSASANVLDGHAPSEGVVATCWYADARYSEGAVVRMGDGYKTCQATGIWA